MKSWTPMLALLTVVVLPLSLAVAQPENQTPRRRGNQEQARPGAGMQRRSPARRPGAPLGNDLLEGLFKRWDANGDGQLMLDEIPEAARARMGRADANGDGQLELSELQRPAAMRGRRQPGQGPGMRPGNDGPMNPGADRRMGMGMRPGQGGMMGSPDWIKTVWQRLDRDGDGTIARKEVPENLQARFDQMDSNGNGKLESEELEAVAARMRTGNPQARGRRGVTNTKPQRPKRPPMADDGK